VSGGRDRSKGREVIVMEDRRFVALVVGLALVAGSPAAHAQDEWVSVAKSDRTELFVKPSTLKWDGDWLSIRTRQNFVEAQPSAKKGKTFLSARNEYRIACAHQKVAYREMQAYAELDLQGAVVQKAKSSEKNLMWMDAPEGTVFGALLEYACDNAPPAAAAP
jgi:hypothetical protein